MKKEKKKKGKTLIPTDDKEAISFTALSVHARHNRLSVALNFLKNSLLFVQN